MKRHPHYYTNIGVALCSTLQSLADAYYTLRPHHVPKYGQHTISYIFFMVSTIQDTFCYQTVQIAPCYVPSFWHAQLSTIPRYTTNAKSLECTTPSKKHVYTTRSCTGRVQGTVWAVYTAVYGPCRWPVYTAVYVHGPWKRSPLFTARFRRHYRRLMHTVCDEVCNYRQFRAIRPTQNH